MPNVQDLCTSEEMQLCGEGGYPGRRLIEAYVGERYFRLRYSKPRWFGTVFGSLACMVFIACFYDFGAKNGLPIGFFWAVSAALILGLIGVCTPSIIALVRNGRSVVVVDRKNQTINLLAHGIQISTEDVICIQQSLLDAPLSTSFDRIQLAELNIVIRYRGERRRFNIAKSSLTIDPFGFVSEFQNALGVPVIALSSNGPGAKPSIVVHGN